jgi:osomolarity two-component system sensor histidine kinase TcsA
MADVCEQVFALSPVASVIVDPSLCVQKASNSFLELTKSPAHELYGRNYLEILKDGVLSAESDLLRVRDIIDQAAHTLEMQTGKHIHISQARVWQIRVIPTVLNHALLYLVVEWLPVPKRQAEDRIGNGFTIGEAFRTLVEAVNDYAIFLLDTKGNVQTWNAGAELNKRYKPHEIIGRHFSIFYGTEDLTANKPAKELEICLREGKVEDEGWRYRKDGTRFWANVIITAIYDDGVYIGFGKVTRDLTERKAAETHRRVQGERRTQIGIFSQHEPRDPDTDARHDIGKHTISRHQPERGTARSRIHHLRLQ